MWHVSIDGKENMCSYSEKIREIKRTLASSDDFNVAFKTFFDFLDDNPDFMSHGKKYKDRILKVLLETVGHSVFNEKVSVTKLRLILMEGEQFIHGACLINGRPAAVMFCPDIEIGLVAIAKSPFSDEMHYARITATVVTGKDAASFSHPLHRTRQ